MNKPSLLFLLGACAAGTLPLRAQTDAATTTPPAAPATAAAPAAPAVSVTATPSYVSEYMFRGQRLGGQSFEPSVEADYGNWALGVWSNLPLANRVPGQSNPEIDPYGSYTWNLSDSLSLQPGFTIYTYENAPTDQGFFRSTYEPNIAVNYTIDGFKLTPKLYYDLVLRGLTSELSATYAVPVKEIGSEFDFAGTIGNYFQDDAVNKIQNPGAKGTGNYWLLGVSLPFTVAKDTKVTVGWAYTEGTGAYVKVGSLPRVDNPEAVGRGVFSASVAYTF
jgi:uncharacterized protein (TIGR02001 family)